MRRSRPIPCADLPAQSSHDAARRTWREYRIRPSTRVRAGAGRLVVERLRGVCRTENRREVLGIGEWANDIKVVLSDEVVPAESGIL